MSYLTVKPHNETQVALQADAVADGNALAIEEWIGARTSMLEATAQALTASEEMKVSLVQLAESGGFLAAYLGRTDGSTVFSDSWQPPSDYDPRERGWYKQAVESNGTVVSKPYVDANTGGMVVTFSTPVERRGKMIGVVGGDIEIDQLVNHINDIRPTPASFAFLSRGGETVIAHPDADLTLEPLQRLSSAITPDVMDRLASVDDSWESITVDGVEKRLSVTQIPGADWELGIALDEDEATESLQAILSATAITVLIIAAVTALLLSLWLKRSFAGLERARDALENIASGEGDLTRRLPEEGRDEVAQIGAAFNRFVGKMEAVMITIRQSSESVRVAATEISSGGQDLSRRTENAASSLQETSASMEQITSTVGHTAESSRQANGLSKSASEVARRGGEAVGQVVDTMQGIRDSSAQISEIVTVMDSIAFQTNLLALNASVEAARAGEQGRGFAVVANEVRQLASRSSEAAKEIKGLIDTSTSRTEDGAEQVRAAGETMNEIVESVTRVTDVLGEITAATGEQSDGISQVNIAVSELDQMTQQNAALVEESTTAAEQLKDQADRLTEAVSGFTVSADVDEPRPQLTQA
ncbi:methyl-accepting chemotaxis protein [Halomonas sp. I5-271120]|uniref:methyl-accepting chemotaxis protein n=1 Tax=Halomonas sp. I5-271120 TaxID=3061632 RepID=UPI00350E4EF6